MSILFGCNNASVNQKMVNSDIDISQNSDDETAQNLSEIEKITLNVPLLEIVKQDNQYKYSCADVANYEYVLLTKDSLSITEIEPLTFSIKIENISENELFVIKESYVSQKFRVRVVEKHNGITFWESIDKEGNILEEPFSFYAIPVKNLDKAKLPVQDCE